MKKLIPSFVFFSVLLSQLCHSESPTGSVQISGTLEVGNVLTASNDLADADGLGSITYQWKRNGSDITLGGSHQDGINNVDGLGGAFAIAVSPDERHVYATGYNDHSVSWFEKNSSTGDFNFKGFVKDGMNGVDGLNEALGIDISTDGKNVYAVGRADNAIAWFDRNSSTGDLTYRGKVVDGNNGVDGLAGAFGVTLSEDGRFAYVSSQNDSAVSWFERNSTDGSLTFRGLVKDGTGGVDGIAGTWRNILTNDQKQLYVTGRDDDSVAWFDRNETTGALTYIGFLRDNVNGVDGLSRSKGLAITADDKWIYITSHNDHSVAWFERNSTTGNLTYVGKVKEGINGVSGLNSTSSVKITKDDKYVYTTSYSSDAIAWFERNATSGNLSYLGSISSGTLDGAYELALSPTSNNYLFATGISSHTFNWFTIDPSNGNFYTGPAQGNIYTLTHADLDSQITVTASYTDGSGNVESVSSSPTAQILGNLSEAPVISQGAGPISKVSSEDTQVSWTASELDATDSDTNAAQLSWSLLSSPSNGTAIVDGNGSSPEVFTYQPNANYHGSDSFSVLVSDGDANDSITINLTINPVDDPAVISGDSSGVLNEDSSFTGDLNATDIEGFTDGSYFSVSTAPTNGTSSIDATDGNWTYLPNSDFSGSDSFVVTVTDDDGNTSTQLISLTVIPVDDPSVISGDSSGVLNEDSIFNGDINATDIEGLTDGSYFSVSTVPTNGSSSIDATDGNWTYSPNPNFYGSDSFVVTVTDDDGNTTTQIVSLTINPIDDQSVISGDTSAITNEDTSITGDLNATDIDGLTDGTYFSISSSPTSGALSINPESGRWTYYPNSNTYGNDSFTVTITDDQGFTSTQVVSLTINPSDDPTSISGDINVTISEDSIATGDLNASDIDGLTDGSYYSISTNPLKGTASVDTVDGNWTYIPSNNFYGLDSFTITITDDQDYTATQEISLIVDSIDDASSISGDINATISEDSIATGDLNASDIDGLTDGSYFSISTNPSNGTALISIEDGNWTYTPSSNFFGTDSFSVTITDDLNYTTIQAISVIISAVDDPTLITGDISGLLFLNHSVTGDLNASDMDGLTDASYFTVQTTPSFGTATVDPLTGSWIYNPQTGFLGDDSFSIQITDDQGFVANQAITLIPQYNVPVAQTESPGLLENDKPIFSGSILYDGGLPILEVGFYTSSSPQFSSTTKLMATLASGDSTFSFQSNQSEVSSTIYIRAFARNQNGETLGEVKRLDPPPIEMQWSSHATVLDTGWLQSDWFGTFHHYPKNWVYHSRLDWIYIPDTTESGIWIWSPEHNWLWTQKGIYPHLYKNSSGDWIYLLEQQTQGKDFYDYQSGLFK